MTGWHRSGKVKFSTQPSGRRPQGPLQSTDFVPHRGKYPGVGNPRGMVRNISPSSRFNGTSRPSGHFPVDRAGAVRVYGCARRLLTAASAGRPPPGQGDVLRQLIPEKRDKFLHAPAIPVVTAFGLHLRQVRIPSRQLREPPHRVGTFPEMPPLHLGGGHLPQPGLSPPITLAAPELWFGELVTFRKSASRVRVCGPMNPGGRWDWQGGG